MAQSREEYEAEVTRALATIRTNVADKLEADTGLSWHVEYGHGSGLFTLGHRFTTESGEGFELLVSDDFGEGVGTDTLYTERGATTEDEGAEPFGYCVSVWHWPEGFESPKGYDSFDTFAECATIAELVAPIRARVEALKAGQRFA